MIVNQFVTGLVVIIVAYLLGSINSAYIITKLMTGKDIRQLGGGNAGGRNVFRSVGLKAAIPVAFFDIAKGVVPIAIAHWLLNVPLYEMNVIILLVGLAAVAGHMWSLYLKFTGGNGLATTIGVLIMILPQGLAIVLLIMLVLTIATRNPVLSLNIGLLSLPFSFWFISHSWPAVIFTVILITIMILNFLPTARAALSDAGSGKALTSELLNRDKASSGEA